MLLSCDLPYTPSSSPKMPQTPAQKPAAQAGYNRKGHVTRPTVGRIASRSHMTQERGRHCLTRPQHYLRVPLPRRREESHMGRNQ